MEIKDLKQPYRRMLEYLGRKNVSLLDKNFSWCRTNHDFWVAVDNGEYPSITAEIKKHFPPDFDFSGEEIKNKPVMQMLDAETQKYIYTQLAKEGKFEQLPDTCEFSEAVELEVWDKDNKAETGKADVVAKFRGKFISLFINSEYAFWNFAQLPTHKIDFSQFKAGDVVEVETISIGYVYGYIREVETDKILLSFGYMSDVLRTITKKKIKSITKIK